MKRLFLLLTILMPSLVVSQFTHEQLWQSYQWRNIGPANQGGRISDIEADPENFEKVYIAVASGGVWRSNNAGTTWKPIFDDYETASIGDIALEPGNSDVIWVGTGEANNRNSVSWGNGVYLSEDGGANFTRKGLSSTHQIARILVHPKEPENVCVCAIGHLWGYSGDRGLFQTNDKGSSWNKLKNGLPDDGKTGCTDIVRNKKNPDIMYAAFYHRLRKPWHFHSGGEQGGIYKTEDGGKTWRKLSNGLPQGPTGRIGLAIYEKNPSILMAIIEAEKSDTLSIPGSGVYRSEDGGENWTYVNTYNNRPFYYSQIRINPHDSSRVYILTTRFMVSEDGGKTLTNGSSDQEVHGDFHALWVDPGNKDRYYLGADKGFSLTHDHGKHFILIDNLPIAQYYRINYDMRIPYYVYGGLQDNGSYATASFSRDARGILNDSNWKMHWGDGQDVAANPYDWTDMYSSMENGAYMKYDPKLRKTSSITPNSFNTENFWEYFDAKKESLISDLRFNWSAPLVMSTHNPDHIYVAGNHVFKSENKGKTWKIISPDLSTNHPVKRQFGISGGITPDNSGAEVHCSVTSLSISELDSDLILAGTDDGQIQLSKNAGKRWRNLRDKISPVPDGIWVSRVVLSRFKKDRMYVSFDGHRSDRNEPWVFISENGGKKWSKITSGLDSNEVVRVILEDHKNENLLFAGTETGVWYSIDKGLNWQRLKLNLPTVSVYDMKIHPRQSDLIIGTHGRSLWILDDISPLQELKSTAANVPWMVSGQNSSTLWHNVSRGGQRGHFLFAGENPKTIINTSSKPRAVTDQLVEINYTVFEERADSLVMTITKEDTKQKATFNVPGTKGIHRVYWDRELENEELTNEDVSELKQLLETTIKQLDNSRVRRAYNNISLTSSSDEIRKTIQPLTNGYLNFEFDDKFLILKAGQGSYKIELTDGNFTANGRLTLSPDPLESDND